MLEYFTVKVFTIMLNDAMWKVMQTSGRISREEYLIPQLLLELENCEILLFQNICVEHSIFENKL